MTEHQGKEELLKEELTVVRSLIMAEKEERGGQGKGKITFDCRFRE